MNTYFKNPNVPPEGSAEARAFRAQRAAQQPGVTTPAPGPAPAPTAPAGGWAARARSAMPQNLGRTGLAAAAFSAIPEIADTAKVAQDKNSTGMDVATQAAEGAGRWGATTAGAVMGAKGGAALGAMTGPFAPVAIPVGGVLGGLAGAALGGWGADKVIRSGRELSGVDAASPVDRVAGQSPSAPPEQPAQQQLGPSPSAPAGTPQTQSLVNAEEMQQRQAAQPTGQQVPGLSGVYKHGYGQYSDNPNGMGLPQSLGQPSAQNMRAANNLAYQQQKRSLIDAMYAQQAQQTSMQPRGFAAPQISHSGNDWSTRNELRSLRMAAERAMENAPRKRFAAQHPAVQAYQAALQADMAARTGGQAALQAKTNDTNAGLVREQMQQEGANQRELPRTMMDAARLEMERKNQELVNRPRTMIAALQEQIAAEQDAARRNSLVQRMRDIEGRSGEAGNLSNNFMRRKVPVLNENGLPTEWQQEEIVDLRTGRVLGAPVTPAAGAVMGGYRFKGGDPADRNNWEAV